MYYIKSVYYTLNKNIIINMIMVVLLCILIIYSQHFNLCRFGQLFSTFLLIFLNFHIYKKFIP